MRTGIVVLSLLLTACGGGGGPSTPSPVSSVNTQPSGPDLASISDSFLGHSLIRVATVSPSGGGLSSEQIEAATVVTTTTPAVDIVHIDNSSTAIGDGSFERPFQSLATCKGSAAALNCQAGKYIYLHAHTDKIVNGIAQFYIGNISLLSGQTLVGDGASEGLFASLSTKTQPILLGESGNSSAVVTMASNSELNGVQVGWTFQETVAGSAAPSDLALPAGAAMPDQGVLINNTSNVLIQDTYIVGALIGDLNTTRNFSSSITITSDNEAINTSVDIIGLTSTRALGSCISAEVTVGDNQTIQQTVNIKSSNITANGRGIHAFVGGSDGGIAKQYIQITSSQNSPTEYDNFIQHNLNEGVLLENLNTLNNVTNSFLADQNLTVEWASIQNNQGAGIQTGLGPNSTSNSSALQLSNVSLHINMGSGLLLSSNSSNTKAELSHVNLVGNLIWNGIISSFGKRADGVAIDCGRPGVTDCNTPGASSIRTAPNYRKTGYGLYAKNSDSLGAIGVQEVTISGDFAATLHSTDGAQLFLESTDLVESGSLQTINLVDSADATRSFFDAVAGQNNIINGSIVTSIDTSAPSPQVSFCSKQTATPSTATDEASPNMIFSGLLSSIVRTEKCP